MRTTSVGANSAARSANAKVELTLACTPLQHTTSAFPIQRDYESFCMSGLSLPVTLPLASWGNHNIFNLSDSGRNVADTGMLLASRC